jgi:hypothetical protein
VFYKNESFPFGAIALLLNKYFVSQHIFALMNYIHILLEAGFNMHEGISPLTVFILKVEYDYEPSLRYVQISDAQPAECDFEPHPASMFIDFLIEHGAHVGQHMLMLRNTDERREALRIQLYVPDVLLAVLKSGKFSLWYKVIFFISTTAIQ